MNTPGSAGEASSKRQENGDGPTGSDRPLKKARFAWQVKGKYHLKNETSETKPSTQSSESEKPSPSTQNISKDLVGSTEQNLEILGDYLLKQDFNTLDSVITDDKSLLKPSTSISSEKLEYPRYIPSQEVSRTSSMNDSSSVPMSMVVSNNYSEEQCIARWQARQMAKGFVDNTINRVLDSWMVTHLPPEVDNNRFLALDVAEFINNLPGDNSIENEGILMAISAHGLQNTSISSINGENSPSKNEETSRSSSPLQSEEEIEVVQNKDSNDNDLQMAWSYDDKDTNDHGFSLFPESSEASYINYSENELHSSKIEYADDNASGNDFTNHFDFMDAAVSFVLQNKGLTSFGTDYD